jgi:hypothetical protein
MSGSFRIARNKFDWAYIERAQAMPKQGASSGFKYGRAIGAIEAVIACCRIPITIIEPAAWKKFHHLVGKDKENSRQRALQMFPAAHVWLAKKKDHGRAEAALIALCGHELNNAISPRMRGAPGCSPSCAPSTAPSTRPGPNASKRQPWSELKRPSVR